MTFSHVGLFFIYFLSILYLYRFLEESAEQRIWHTEALVKYGLKPCGVDIASSHFADEQIEAQINNKYLLRAYKVPDTAL